MTVVLDIETIPLQGPVTDIDDKYLPKIDSRLTDPKKIEAATAELQDKINFAKAIDPDFGRIISVCAIDIDNKGKQYAFGQEDEKAMLTDFWALMKKVNPGFRTITFNGIHFDIPYLFRRSLYHRIDVPCQMVLKRYSYMPHFDVLQVLSDWDSRRFKSLDFYCQSFGLEIGKTGDGSHVLGLYQAGDWEAILEYCLNDCRVTLALFNIIKDYYPIDRPTKFDRRGEY
jgi:3'-5' exonuclease